MSVLIPQGSSAEGLARQQQMQAAIGNLRLTIGREIYARMIADDYQIAKVKAAKEADPYNTGEVDDEKALNFPINLGGPAGLSLQAADVFLIAAGLLQPPNDPSGKVNGS